MIDDDDKLDNPDALDAPDALGNDDCDDAIDRFITGLSTDILFNWILELTELLGDLPPCDLAGRDGDDDDNDEDNSDIVIDKDFLLSILGFSFPPLKLIFSFAEESDDDNDDKDDLIS